MNFFYSCFKILIRFSLQFYFHKIKIEGRENVPKNTPLVITPNHQNAFLDALLVGAFIPISLHFLARQDVFKRWSRPILRSLKMLPVYRIRDGYSSLSKNDTVFETCRDIFSLNGSVLIFAEGNHGRYHYLRPLTKGAARLALQSEAVLDKEMMVLPVGLNYFQHLKANSTVLIKFGKPIPVRTYLDQFNENQAKGLIALRDAIAAGMKKTLVIPEESSDYEEKVQVIFQEKNEDLSFDELRSIHGSEILEPIKSRKYFLAKFLNPVPFLIIRLVIGRVEDVVFHSSLKFGIGLFLFPLWWLVVFCIMFFLTGINIALLMVIVMIFGLYYSYLR